MGKILLVDDDPHLLMAFEELLVGKGHDVVTSPSVMASLKLLDSEQPEAVVMDICMPEMNGLDALTTMKDSHPGLPIILITGRGTIETAIEATKRGAFDYQLKPFEPAEMLRVIDRAIESARLSRKLDLNPKSSPYRRDAFLGHSSCMQEVFKAIGRVAQTDATVLITGESGTGKELVARAIHQHSLRHAKPLLAVNCVAIPETLLESELFGYERGAFTGAAGRRIGKFEQADQGTIFLDEIGDLASGVQAKILRVLQERSFQRLGGNAIINTDVRVIAATNRDLSRAIANGAFRRDLLHRLNVVTIHLPPLHERREDIRELVHYFLERYAAELQIPKPAISPDAISELESQPWPGHVRELQNCVYHVLIFTRGHAIQAQEVRDVVNGSHRDAAVELMPKTDDLLSELLRGYLSRLPRNHLYAEIMEKVERCLLIESLQRTSGNQSQAARLLGITRPTLHAKLSKYRISSHVAIK